MSSFSEGNPHASLMIVNGSPGRTDLANNTLLMEYDGKLLWGMLAKKCNISRADAYILNTIGEWAAKDDIPSAAQYEEWWDRFEEAFSAFTGKVVLILGGPTFKRLGGDGGITDWRGYLMRPEEFGAVERKRQVQTVYKSTGKGHKKGDPRIVTVKTKEPVKWPESVEWIIPTVHPKSVIKSGYTQAPAFAADISRVGRAIRGTLRPVAHAYSEGPPLVDWVRAGMTRLPRGLVENPVSIDIETRMGGLNADSIERIGVAGNEGCWTAVWDTAARHSTVEALSCATVSIAHNIGFDAPRLLREGVRVPEPWFDTMYAALLLQPDLLKGLNGVIPLYLDTQRHKHLSESEPAKYNALDTIRELELYHALRAQLRETGQLELFEGTIMRALPTLVDMGEEGVRVDSEGRNKWVIDLESRLAQGLSKWRVVAGNVNPFSPQQLKEFLYGTLGLPEQLSKYGGTTTDSGALGELLGLRESQQHRETLELLLHLRDTNKQLETYAKVDVSADGHIHPSWVPASKDTEGFGKGLAGTGRITSRGPNFQNISPEAKKLYIPREGCTFIEADYSQIEARVIAALSGDRILLKAIKHGLHTANMSALGVDKTRAKNFFYGWSYGAGARTLRRTFLSHGFDISEAECKAALRKLEETYPDVTRWRREVADRAAQTYRLVNAFQRRRNFFRGGGDTPAALDFLPQSTAADCLWAVVRPLADALGGIGARICGLIHDSVLIECPSGEVAQGAQILREHMQREFPQIAPGFYVPVEMKVGASWGSMTPLEQKQEAA